MNFYAGMICSAKSISSKPREGNSLSGEWILGVDIGEKTDVSRSEPISTGAGSIMT
jgi:hypothetical protein